MRNSLTTTLVLLTVLLSSSWAFSKTETTNEEQVFFKDMGDRYNAEIKRLGYDQWTNNGHVNGPVAIPCYPSYNMLRHLTMSCKIPPSDFGQPMYNQTVFVVCVTDQGCRAESGQELGYWSDPFKVNGRGGVSFHIPPGYYVWYGAAYLIGYGPLYQEGFNDAVDNVNDHQMTETPAETESFKAWCNPQQDDECYINEKKVSIKDLPKHLPTKDCDNTEGLLGAPGDPFCYDFDGNVKAVSQRYYQ